MAGQGQRAKYLRRPVQRLYPLEMPTQDKQADTSPEHSGSPLAEPDDLTQEAEHPPAGVSPKLDEVPPPSTSRPCRTAVSEGWARVLALALGEDEKFS